MSEKKSFWTTTIGILTAVTGLLAAIGGLLGGLAAADIIGCDKITEVVLTISITEGGSTVPNAGQYSFEKDSQVDITANAEDGWEFDYWSGTDDDDKNPTIVIMNDNKHVAAYFKPLPAIVIYKWQIPINDKCHPSTIAEVRKAVCLTLAEKSISQDASINFQRDIELQPREELADESHNLYDALGLLKEAGYPTGFEVTAVAIPIYDPFIQYIAERIKAQLKMVYIEIDIVYLHTVKHISDENEFMVIQRSND
jgi:hypothetical protein